VKAVDAGVAADREVGLLRARVGGEVARVVELGRIHEDRDPDAVGALPRDLEQRSVPRVQRAHRRHERDAPPRGALRVGARLESLYVVDALHALGSA